MTLEEHNKTIGILHIVYAALHTLLMLAVFALMLFFFSVVGAEVTNQPGSLPAAVIIPFIILGGVIALLFTVPSYVAGYAMLRRKPWGRVASLVAAVVEVMNVPFGTAVGIYALWFMFGKGQALYAGDALTPGPRPAFEAAPAGADYDRFGGARSQQPSAHMGDSRPPGQPPDWRGE